MSAVLNVVTVFATSCQVSENANNGPEANQTMIRKAVTMNAQCEPAAFAVRAAKRENQWLKPRCGNFRPIAT